jgi:hypothetical protein
MRCGSGAPMVSSFSIALGARAARTANSAALDALATKSSHCSPDTAAAARATLHTLPKQTRVPRKAARLAKPANQTSAQKPSRPTAAQRSGLPGALRA